MFLMVFALGAMAAGIAGVIYAPLAAVIPNMGEPFLVECFVVVVIGGLGSFPGARGRRHSWSARFLSLTTPFNPAYAQAAIYARHDAGADGAAARPVRRDGAGVMARLRSCGGRHDALAARIVVAIALALLPFVLRRWLGSVDLFTRILIWGLFGLGFDLLFGCTGLLSFGQAAFYGTGGFVTAYLLDQRHI